jgi:hypothetical protein
MPKSISPFVFEGFPNDDWESATPPQLMETVLSVRSLGGDGFFRIDTLLKKEQDIRREPRPWISFGTCYKEREKEAQRAAREIFDKFLLIGTTNRAIIKATPVAWAYGQAEATLHHEFGSTKSIEEFCKIKLWIKEYCDGEDQSQRPALGPDTDWKRYFLRQDWRAPLWLEVAAYGHFNNNLSPWAGLTEESMLHRLNEEQTETLLNGICRVFWSSVRVVLQNKARLESINLATQLGVGSATGGKHVESAIPRTRLKGTMADSAFWRDLHDKFVAFQDRLRASSGATRLTYKQFEVLAKRGASEIARPGTSNLLLVWLEAVWKEDPDFRSMYLAKWRSRSWW